jgi:formamidopyrimidine-DNA glycosylase
VHNLKRTVVGKTLTKVTAVDDANVFGKVGTTGAEVQKALTGKKVLDAGRQGKYFWLIMSSPPHPVFHFGMTGWFHIRGDKSGHYRQNGSDEPEDKEWPPKSTKLTLETAEEAAAFSDKRRFGRIRLVNCAGEDIRKTTPLKENGPDPVLDKDIFTAEWLEAKMRKKHVPIKALLLDQANISGIGNWVG